MYCSTSFPVTVRVDSTLPSVGYRERQSGRAACSPPQAPADGADLLSVSRLKLRRIRRPGFLSQDSESVGSLLAASINQS